MQNTQKQLIPAVETVILGRYIVEGLMGGSSGGTTLLVRDRKARRGQSGLFVLKEAVESSKQARHRLTSEGKVLKRLNHQSIPRVRKICNDRKNDRIYLLTEYIAGDSLENLCLQQPDKRFSSSQAITIMSPIFAAVTYLHNQRTPVIHGDIKPENIISGEDSNIWLVGLGVKRVGGSDSSSNAEQHCYKAPEQFLGSNDVGADVYGLAATFYRLLAGRTPPNAKSRLKRLSTGATDPLRSINSVVAGIPPHVGRALERALSLNPQHRFSSAEQFWYALWYLDEQQITYPNPFHVEESPVFSARQLERMAEREAMEITPTQPLVTPKKEQLQAEQDPDATVRLRRLPPWLRSRLEEEERARGGG